MTLRILDDAWDEIYEAANWYESKQPGLGAELGIELNDAFREIALDPERFARIDSSRRTSETRRHTLARFPYSIIFVCIKDDVVVIAVTHAKRRPNYWKKRIP